MGWIRHSEWWTKLAERYRIDLLEVLMTGEGDFATWRDVAVSFGTAELMGRQGGRGWPVSKWPRSTA